MGLSKKTFLYSIALAAIMTAFIVGYFVIMLPSLYVDYVMKNNLKSAAKIHEGYREEESYDNLTVKNPSSTFSIKIPDVGNEIYAAGKFFQMTIEVQDEELQIMLDSLRSMMHGMKAISDDFSQEELLKLWGQISEKFSEQNMISESAPVTVHLEGRENQGVYKEEYSKIHMISEECFVYEGGVSDGNYSYTTYVAMSHDKDGILMTVLPTMTPQMGEIRPVVMESLPMIAAVMFLLVLLSSRFFSKRIVNPIIRLADYAENVRISNSFWTEDTGFGEEPGSKLPNSLSAAVPQTEPAIHDNKQSLLYAGGYKDEIGVLGNILQELYRELSMKYQELAQKNRALEEENERQEVFLRATSHQLKTPVAAALLLVEGMMNEVGKYKNAKEYLPEVKKQLLSMRKIVEDILYLNYHAENGQKETILVEDLVKELLKNYQVQVEKKGLQTILKGSGSIWADREMMEKIVDNILSNAVQYTPMGEKIEIEVGKGELCIRNYGVTIDKKLMPGIYKPFVSSDESKKGKGLGLYVASYYSRLSGCKLNVENMENGVQARLLFS